MMPLEGCFVPSFGQYRLNMDVRSIDGLRELTPFERATLAIQIIFRDQKLFHAPPASFVGISWDIIIGAVNNSIFKLSGLLESTPDDVLRAAKRVASEITFLVGNPSEIRDRIWAWDLADGNVVMNIGSAVGFACVALTFTSDAEKHLTLAG